MGSELATQGQQTSLAELSVQDVTLQAAKVQEVMRAVMKVDEHYGVIPGCKKPSLYKPGAEKIGFTFRIMPKFQIERLDLPGGHREYIVTCELYHVGSGQFVGSGVGSCSSMEAKYRYRAGKELTGEPVPGAYWSLKKTDPAKAQEMLGGKGFSTAKNPETNQWEICRIAERVEHDNPADHFNTILKMAKKRAHVDAILTATAASDIFTQDLEDLRANGVIDAEVVNTDGATAVQEAAKQTEQPKTVTPPTQDKDEAARAELVVICTAIAEAGGEVTTQDQGQTFGFVDASDIASVDLLADGNCKTLSTFVRKSTGEIVPGKAAKDLSGKWLQLALKNARAAHEQLAALADQPA